MIAEPRVDAEAQALSEAVLLGIAHVLFGGADRRICRHLGGRAVRAVVGIPFEAIVADDAHTLRLFGVKGMIKKRIG